MPVGAVAPEHREAVVSWWEGKLDRSKLNAGLNQKVDTSDIETGVTTG